MLKNKVICKKVVSKGWCKESSERIWWTRKSNLRTPEHKPRHNTNRTYRAGRALDSYSILFKQICCSALRSCLACDLKRYFTLKVVQISLLKIALSTMSKAKSLGHLYLQDFSSKEEEEKENDRS